MANVIEHDFGHVQPEDEGHKAPPLDPALCDHPKAKTVLVYRCTECGSETVVFDNIWTP